MQNTKQHLIDSIKQALFEDGKTQVGLAKELGVSKTWVQSMLKGKSSIEKLIAVLNHLGYTVNLEVKYTGE